jgi:hypothetical protein
MVSVVVRRALSSQFISSFSFNAIDELSIRLHSMIHVRLGFHLDHHQIKIHDLS